MSGRRRRGRRRPWEQREGSGQPGQPGQSGQPGQPRFGTNGQPNGPLPQRSFGGYGAASGQPRWQGGVTGQGPRRPEGGNARFGRGRWSNGAQAGQGGQRRWAPGTGGQGQHAQSQRWQPGGRPQRRPNQQEPQRRPAPPALPPGSEIDPFELFCAYHLGITADDGYRIQNIHEVARRFGTNAGALRQTLAALGMDADDIVHSGFDLASAQIDIMVAPAGISRRELARPLYDEFKAAPRKARDWAREMREADHQIERTIGQDGRWSPPPRDRAGKQS